MKLRVCFVIVSFFSVMVCTILAQTASNPTPASTQVPRLIKVSGVAKDESGKPITGVVGITFSLYKEPQEGTPLWMETQNVQADATGHYSASLGSASTDGVPLEIFSSAEAQWIGTRISGQAEQPRILLLSVPYALKAQEAETLAGRPVSDFVLVPQSTDKAAGSVAAQKPGGTKGALASDGPTDFSGTTTDQIVKIEQDGTGAALLASSPGVIAVRVNSTGSTGLNEAIVGYVASNEGFAVEGNATATAGSTIGVEGVSNSTGKGFGVLGKGTIGVEGSSLSTMGTGVVGEAIAKSGSTVGVSGTSESPSGVGVVGNAIATSGLAFGVDGLSASPSGVGLHGVNTASGGAAIQGFATATSGVGVGVSGFSASPSGAGVLANNSSTGEFVNLAGPTPFIIDAHTTTTTLFSVDSSGNGFFDGNLAVKGELTKGSGSFKIDHPLDPANKYLSHSFVESPDMMNVYNGNITTDRHGLATVTLPDYFEALNQDFRYQLTVIGQFAQAIVKREIENNRFTIKTNKPLVKVSWQVTGIRQDAYANAYRIQVEEEKPPQEQGQYLHPELFGAPAEQAIGYHAPPVPTQPPTQAETAHVSSLK
jgi:hypothetical protein